MEDSAKLYIKIQTLVQNEARKIATEVYNELGTQYDVAEVPAHSHNGVDSNQLAYKNIIQGDKYTTGLIEDTSETITIGGIFNPTRILFQGFAANNAGVNLIMGGALASGATAGTLTTPWGYSTTDMNAIFSNGNSRIVTFTNATGGIGWATPLTSAVGTTITLPSTANQRTILNGEINFGSCFDFSDLTPPLSISTSGVGKPFTSSANSMYINSADLTKTKVSTSEGVTGDASGLFIYSTDDTGAIIASAQPTIFNNQLGLLTIVFVVGTNWKIQGALTIT